MIQIISQIYFRLLSPLGATPAIHNSKMEQSQESLNLHPYTSPVVTSSSESGSDSASDSDSSSDDSVEENLVTVSNAKDLPRGTEPEHTSPKPEEGNKSRWNLASFIPNNQSSVTEPQTSPAKLTHSLPLPTSPDSRKRLTEESDTSESSKVIEKAVAEAKALASLMLINLSDSDSSRKEITLKRKWTTPPVTKSPVSSDSESERTRNVKPVSRVNPRTKSTSNCDSDIEPSKPCETATNTVLTSGFSEIPSSVVVPDKTVKPLRGRPRKNPINKSSDKEIKKRGRPKLNKVSQSRSESSDTELKKVKRVKPQFTRPPSPSSSEEDEQNKFEKPLPPPRRRTQSKRQSSSSSDSESPGPRRRKTSTSSYKKIDSDKDSNSDISKNNKSKPLRTEERKRSKKDSDDEWGAENKAMIKNHFKDDPIKKTLLDSSKKKRDLTSPSSSRRIGRPSGSKRHAPPKSAPIVLSTDSSSDDSKNRLSRVKPKLSVNSSPEDSIKRILSDSDSDIDNTPSKKTPVNIDSTRKVDENKTIADKKKSDTLRKLFTPKRDSEGGKGGAKGGGKGGKGGKGKFMYIFFFNLFIKYQ